MRTAASLVAAVLVLAGCSGGATPTPLGMAPIDARSAERLLGADDISHVGADIGDTERRVEDLRSVAAAIGADQVEHIVAWYSVTFSKRDAGIALVLVVIEYDDPTSAEARLDTAEAGPGFEPVEPAIGDRTLAGAPNEDVGTAVTFLDGMRLVTLQVPVQNDGTRLLTTDQLLELARLVADRL